MKTLLAVLLISTLLSQCMAKEQLLSKHFIERINSKQTSWIAGHNFPEDISTKDLKHLVGSLHDPTRAAVPIKFHDVIPENIPDTFDGRTYWTNCESLKDIRDQGRCGSCWAFGAVEAITDRICIASGGKLKFKASPEDVLTCCAECGSCDGGFMTKAWEYWVQNGLVSGGDYNSNEGCQPYQKDVFEKGITPSCSTSCLNKNYGISYNNDKHYGESHYRVQPQDILQIQTEILKNGPIEVDYTVYDDFYNYKSGVYVHTEGEKSGGHAVKVIGWGTENGLPYWLVANSWGESWGDLGGFFKILRGENHCGIEEWPIGGIPKL